MVIKEMRNLFLAAAIICAAALTSCDNKGTEGVDDGTVKMYAVSEDVLTFKFWGGEHSSYYSIRNIPRDSVIVATATQDWVTDFETDDIGEVRYVVEPNDSGAPRETTLRVSCDDAYVEYSISQLTPDVTCKSASARCTYYGIVNSENPNYQLSMVLNDSATNKHAYSLDLYCKLSAQGNNPKALPLGTYNLNTDHINFREGEMVIYTSLSGCSLANGTNLTFESAVLTVTADKLVLRAITNDGQSHLATYYGALEVVDMGN